MVICTAIVKEGELPDFTDPRHAYINAAGMKEAAMMRAHWAAMNGYRGRLQVCAWTPYLAWMQTAYSLVVDVTGDYYPGPWRVPEKETFADFAGDGGYFATTPD